MQNGKLMLYYIKKLTNKQKKRKQLPPILGYEKYYLVDSFSSFYNIFIFSDSNPVHFQSVQCNL